MIKTPWFELDLNALAALVTALTAAYLAYRGKQKRKGKKDES